MSKKVIARTYFLNSPAKIILLNAIIWLYMDKYNAPGWLHEIVWTIIGLLFVGVTIEFLEKNLALQFLKEIKRSNYVFVS